MNGRSYLVLGLAGTAVLLPGVAALAHDKHVMVDIKGYAYAPVQPVVHVGDTIMWTNEDGAPHTVTSISGPTKLDSPELRKGETWTFTATAAGSYRYYCAVHPEMKAGLVVEPAAATTPSAVPSTRSAVTKSPPAAAAPVPSRPAAASQVHASAPPTATLAPSEAPASPPVQAAAPAPRQETLDPDLLLVALACGAVLTGLLVLGRRATA